MKNEKSSVFKASMTFKYDENKQLTTVVIPYDAKKNIYKVPSWSLNMRALDLNLAPFYLPTR